VHDLLTDAQVRAEIDALLAFLDGHLRSPHGGFLEGLPASMPRRQNPQMHLLEAMIAVFEATRDAVFQNCAGDLFALFLANLYDKQKRVLGEYFEDDWSKIEPVSVEPGHQAEWTWLLKGFERITGCPTGRYRSELLASALRYRDEGTGCLIDEGDAGGNIRRHTRRLWPQTERIKAGVLAARMTGQPRYWDTAAAGAEGLLKYLDVPVPGLWVDRYQADGSFISEPAPASSLYHIICGILEMDIETTAALAERPVTLQSAL
jgi:mannose-6-phosphate isomerase